MLFFSTMVEPSEVNLETKPFCMAAPTEFSGRSEFAWKKDRWPMRLFQYGNAFLPDGPNSTDFSPLDHGCVKPISKPVSGEFSDNGAASSGRTHAIVPAIPLMSLSGPPPLLPANLRGHTSSRERVSSLSGMSTPQVNTGATVEELGEYYMILRRRRTTPGPTIPSASHARLPRQDWIAIQPDRDCAVGTGKLQPVLPHPGSRAVNRNSCSQPTGC